jgi:PiT family inorganic phosphate transporter
LAETCRGRIAVPSAGQVSLRDALNNGVVTSWINGRGASKRCGAQNVRLSGLQIETVRNLLLAWVLTLPASMGLAGSLFWLFSKMG